MDIDKIAKVIYLYIRVYFITGANSAFTPSSCPYCVPTVNQDAAESPWTRWGRSENAEGRSKDPNDADRPRLF